MGLIKLAAPKWFKVLAENPSLFKNKNVEKHFAKYIEKSPGARSWADKYFLKNDPRAIKPISDEISKKIKYSAKNPSELAVVKKIFSKYHVHGLK